MKLKVKLAREYGQHIKKTDSPTCDPVNVGYDWLQGFQKAREMACEIEWNAAGNSEQLEKFKNLGEEEV